MQKICSNQVIFMTPLKALKFLSFVASCVAVMIVFLIVNIERFDKDIIFDLADQKKT